jgi:hypothetical protein
MNGEVHKVAWPANQPLTDVRFRVEFVASTRDGLIEQLAEFMGAEGYFVSKKIAWEKTGDFRKRMNLAVEGLQRILASPLCPPVELHRGRGCNGHQGKLLAINSNPLFEAFVVALRGTTPKRVKGVRKPRGPKTIAEGRPSRRKPASELRRARMHGPKRNYVAS